MYSTTYQTKKGSNVVFITRNYDELKRRAKWLFRQKLVATFYHDGINIGEVYEDYSERTGFGYSLKKA